MSSLLSRSLFPSLAAEGPARKKRRTEELKSMMYGFGDAWDPLDESVALMDDLVNEYMVGMTRKAMEVTKLTKQPLSKECVWFTVRKDPKKVDKIKQLLLANEQLNKNRTVDLDKLSAAY